MNTKPIVEIRPIDNRWATTIEYPGSTLRMSKSFDTEDEAINYGNKLLSELPIRVALITPKPSRTTDTAKP